MESENVRMWESENVSKRKVSQGRGPALPCERPHQLDFRRPCRYIAFKVEWPRARRFPAGAGYLR